MGVENLCIVKDRGIKSLPMRSIIQPENIMEDCGRTQGIKGLGSFLYILTKSHGTFISKENFRSLKRI